MAVAVPAFVKTLGLYATRNVINGVCDLVSF